MQYIVSTLWDGNIVIYYVLCGIIIYCCGRNVLRPYSNCAILTYLLATRTNACAVATQQATAHCVLQVSTKWLLLMGQ